MSDELYDIDALAWSEQQAALLRRVARGERVNDADWPHIIEEIEDVGQSQLRACRSLLRQALIHLLKITGWPDCQSVPLWRGEARRFLFDARDAFAPSMRQRLDLPDLYGEALSAVAVEVIDGRPPPASPADCPFTLDDLVRRMPDLAALEAKLRAAAA